MESGIEMSKAKSWDYMVAFLIEAPQKPKQSDSTEFTEKCLLNGYKITGKQQYLARNLEPVAVV